MGILADEFDQTHKTVSVASGDVEVVMTNMAQEDEKDEEKK